MTNEELLRAIREAAINNQRELKLINCQLTNLPPEIGSLTDLLSLDLRHNQLTSLPPEIGSLTRLKSLRLSNNRLTSLPPEIGSLTNLRFLDLSTNQLTSLPLDIICLTRLYLLENSIFVGDRLNVQSKQQITVYHQKWRMIAEYATECDRDETAKAIKDIYQLIGREEPDILFFKSYYQAFEELGSEFENKPPGNEFLLQPSKLLYIWLQKSSSFSRLMRDMWIEQRFQGIRSYSQMKNQLWDLVLSELRIKSGIGIQYNSLLTKTILPIFWVEGASLFDFCHSVLNCQPPKEWDIYQALAKQPVWISPYENFCVVCDRPHILRFDNEKKCFHAAGEPAIQFADGFSIYVYRGIRLPEEYGKLHPSKWRADWLFLEKNPDVRQALIQGIGYRRIYQELQAVQLDSWQGCNLLKINVKVEEQRIYLFITSDPNKGRIREFIEVPPNVRTVAEAIKYLNTVRSSNWRKMFYL